MPESSSFAVAATDCIAWLAEAEALLAARRLSKAVACFQQAEAAGSDPDLCAGGRWLALMLNGEFERAWQESDAIRLRGQPDPHRFWQGEPLAGKRVILRCLHGFGDAVQFLRYVPRLRALASHVVVEVPPRFVELARCFVGVDEVITWGPDAPGHPPKWDVQIEIMELPYIFRTQMNDLPIATNYLNLPKPISRPQDKLQVGVAWAAGSWNAMRSIPFALLQPLLATQECVFWNLQGGPEDLRSKADTSLREDARCRESIAELAATIAGLDLVITVDTLVAHIAGALGIEGWVLLQQEADWRWMHARNDSPWYPSLRLFRQATPGNWQGVIASVGSALQIKLNGGQAVSA